MRNLIFCISLFFTIFIIISCEQIGYKTTPSGLTYFFLKKNPQGALPKSGQILKILFQRSISSPLIDTIAQVDYTIYNPQQTKNSKQRYNLSEIFNYLHEGDSVLVVIPLDSVISKDQSLSNLPNYQPGKTINYYIKLQKILPNDSAYKQDIKLSQDLASHKEPEKILRYANKHQFYGFLKNGVFVSNGRKGHGPLIELGDTLELRYKGFLIGGNREAFDSNFPENGQQINPPLLSFIVGSSEIIEGFNRAVLGHRIGDSLNVLIPAKLAYGINGAGRVIPPNSSLHFCLRLEKLHKKAKSS